MKYVWILAILLTVALVPNGALAQNGVLFERVDGTWGYTVNEDDDLGQWGVALGHTELWLELVAANPQLTDPDLVHPGDELNVPPTLVRTFKLFTASLGATYVDETPEVITHDEPVPVAVVERRFPWGWALAVLALVIALGYLWHSRRSVRRTMREKEDSWNEQVRAQTRDAQRRELADPYAGPAVVPGGLPTVESAERHFAGQYRRFRRGLTVGENEGLPERVVIERIEPVDVKGSMGVVFADDERPVTKELEAWTPAWMATLSDGSVRITLMMCGNDVYAGGGYEVLPDTQIRPRQDVPVYAPEEPTLVWPVEEGPTPVDETEVDVPQLAEYTSVKVSGPKRYVLHTAAGQDRIVDLGVLTGITLGIDDAEIYVTLSGQRQVIGRLVDQAESTDASTDERPPAATIDETDPRRAFERH